jgi:hypothetical protein
MGNHCNSDSDCASSSCYLGPGGGYCTAPCEMEGRRRGCPPETVCKATQGGALRCLLVCGSDSSCGHDQCAADFCPMGSACVPVANATVKACEPQP